jgi:hypothetical protein
MTFELKTLYPIPDHEERGLALLVSQFQNSPNIKAIIRIFSKQIQEIQDQLAKLYYERSLETAVGAQLDGLGEILVLPRITGEDDESYRLRLRFRGYSLYYSGTPEQVLAALKGLTEANLIQYLEIFPAAYQMFTDGENFIDNTLLPPEEQVSHNIISKFIHEISPAAVQYVPICATYGVPIPFRFAGKEVSSELVIYSDDPAYNNGNLQALTLTDTYYYNVNTGVYESVPGGFAAEVGTVFYILGLDDNTFILELDGGYNLLLETESSFIDSEGAGQFGHCLYYDGSL